MAIPSLPPADPSFTWRSATLGDAAALAALSAAVDEVEDLEDPLGPEGARYYLTFPGVDVARDTLLGLSADGSVLAFAWVWAQAAAGGTRAIAWFEAHPTRPDLEPPLLSWLEAHAAERLGALSPDGPARVRLHLEEHRSRRRRALETAGYRHARTFVEMHRSLPIDLVPPPPPLPGVAVVPWDRERDDAARLASNDAFALHWDSLPIDEEDWQQRVTGDSTFRPDLSYLALAADEVVALCVAAVDPEHDAREAVREVWVERVATRPAWQRRGLATSLLHRTLEAASRAGMNRAGLAADEANQTRATAVYAHLGFVPTRRTLAYVKELPSGRAPSPST